MLGRLGGANLCQPAIAGIMYYELVLACLRLLHGVQVAGDGGIVSVSLRQSPSVTNGTSAGMDWAVSLHSLLAVHAVHGSPDRNPQSKSVS